MKSKSKLYHSSGPWKDHEYIDKIIKAGKVRYIYAKNQLGKTYRNLKSNRFSGLKSNNQRGNAIKDRIIGLLGGDLKKKVEKSNKELEDAKREFIKYDKASTDFYEKLKNAHENISSIENNTDKKKHHQLEVFVKKNNGRLDGFENNKARRTAKRIKRLDELKDKRIQKYKEKGEEYVFQAALMTQLSSEAKEKYQNIVNENQLNNFLYKISPLGIYDRLKEIHTSIKAEKEELKRIKENKNIDPSTGLRLKTKKTSAEEDLAHVNPGYKNFSPDTKQNCMMCTTTFELRRRGYDVTAQKENVGATFNDLTRWFPDADVKEVFVDYEDIDKDLISQGDGARGNLMIPLTTGGGHSIAYEIKNGKIILYDGQSNKVIKDELEVFEYLHELSTGVLYYARLDNCRINPEQIRKDACR